MITLDAMSPSRLVQKGEIVEVKFGGPGQQKTMQTTPKRSYLLYSSRSTKMMKGVKSENDLSLTPAFSPGIP